MSPWLAGTKLFVCLGFSPRARRPSCPFFEDGTRAYLPSRGVLNSKFAHVLCLDDCKWLHNEHWVNCSVSSGEQIATTTGTSSSPLGRRGTAVLAASPVLPRRPQPSAMTLPDLPSADASAPLDCPKTAFLDIVASSLARLDGCHHKVFESK